VAKLEQSVGVGATKKVGLSSTLSGIDKGLEAPIEGMDNIHEWIDVLERLQQLMEEQVFFRVRDGGFEGIGGGDFDSTRGWVRESMPDDQKVYANNLLHQSSVVINCICQTSL